MTNYKDARYNFSGANLTTIPTSAVTSGTFADARFSSGNITQHASGFDDTNIVNDLALIALKAAIRENSAAHNFPNMHIQIFQDDTEIGTETNTDRHGSEYMYVNSGATGLFNSDNQTANATISSGGIVVLYANSSGTATINTHLIAKISANGGTNYETVTLSALGTFSSGILMAGAQGVTISNTGTSMKYQIEFTNQSSITTHVHGIALCY